MALLYLASGNKTTRTETGVHFDRQGNAHGFLLALFQQVQGRSLRPDECGQTIGTTHFTQLLGANN